MAAARARSASRTRWSYRSCWHRIINQLDGAPARLAVLRHLAYGGARMPTPVLEKALATFPDVDFVNARAVDLRLARVKVGSPPHDQAGHVDHRDLALSCGGQHELRDRARWSMTGSGTP
jgi:hypothetical protein